MAIGWASVRYVRRSQGGNIVRQAAYNARTELYSERYGENYDWTHKAETREFHDVLLPTGAPDRLRDAQTLWNAVDGAERRRDAQTAREIILALPKDADLATRIELARSFAQEHFVSKGLAVQINLHHAHIGSDGQNENPHAHLLVTTRYVLQNGELSPTKARVHDATTRRINGRNLVVDGMLWSEAWAEHQRKHGIDVDPPKLIPGKHLGRGHVNNPTSEIAKEQASRQAVNDRLEHDHFSKDLLLAITSALATRDPEEQAHRLIDGIDRAVYVNEGAEEKPSDFARALMRVVTTALSVDEPERVLVEGVREAIRRLEVRAPAATRERAAAGAGAADLNSARQARYRDRRHDSETATNGRQTRNGYHEGPPPVPPNLEQLRKDAVADQVPSDHRRLTVQDVAAELSPAYKRAQEELQRLTWERRVARSAMQQAEAQRGAGEYRVAERRQEIGWLRSALHNIRAPGQRWNEVRFWQDRQLYNWMRLESGGEYGLSRHGTKAKLAEHQTDAARRRMEAAFDEVRPQAETELQERQQRALNARVALEELRIKDAEYVERARGYDGGSAMADRDDETNQQRRNQADALRSVDNAQKLAELGRTRAEVERSIEEGRGRDLGRER